jgi:hypothetical protein
LIFQKYHLILQQTSLVSYSLFFDCGRKINYNCIKALPVWMEVYYPLGAGTSRRERYDIGRPESQSGRAKGNVGTQPQVDQNDRGGFRYNVDEDVFQEKKQNRFHEGGNAEGD